MALTSLKPVPPTTSFLFDHSSDIVKGTIIGFVYRRIDRSEADFGAEVPVGGPRYMTNLEARIKVDQVLFKKSHQYPSIQVGDTISLWVSGSDIEDSRWFELSNKEKIYFLRYNPLRGNELWIDGYNTQQWPLQAINETEVLDILIEESKRDVPLPGQAGLDAAVHAGKLKRATAADFDAWLSDLRKDLAPSEKGSKIEKMRRCFKRLAKEDAYVILEDFVYPSGLYGAGSVVFLIPRGRPVPTGDPGHSEVYDGNKAASKGPAFAYFECM